VISVNTLKTTLLKTTLVHSMLVHSHPPKFTLLNTQTGQAHEI